MDWGFDHLPPAKRSQATMGTWRRMKLLEWGWRTELSSPRLSLRSMGSSPSGHSSLTRTAVAGRLSLEQKAGEGGAVGGAVPAPAGGGANAIRGGGPAWPSRPSSPGADGTGRLHPPRGFARPSAPAASAAPVAAAAPAAAADGPGQATTGECPPLLPEGGLGTRAGPTG